MEEQTKGLVPFVNRTSPEKLGSTNFQNFFTSKIQNIKHQNYKAGAGAGLAILINRSRSRVKIELLHSTVSGMLGVLTKKFGTGSSQKSRVAGAALFGWSRSRFFGPAPAPTPTPTLL